MRIQHVINSMDPSTGGPPAVVARLAAAQAAILGSQGSVSILCHDLPHVRTQVDQSLRGIPGMQRVPMRLVPRNLIGRAIVPRALHKQLKEHVLQADVLHLHGVWDPILPATSSHAWQAGIPYVITPHGMMDPWCMEQGKWKKRLALAMGYRRMLSRAACLHLLNQDECDLIAPLNLPTPRRVIPNGVFLEELEPLPTPGAFYKAHPELRGEPFVLFLGRLHYKKGLDFLADSFAIIASKHAGTHLVVAGPDDGARSDFEARIVRAGLGDRVHLVGPIFGREKFAAMTDATCFCLPSRQEGFSMAILESIVCGTPVVISENCHFPEIATASTGAAGEVVPLDALAIAGALDRMLADPARRRMMGEAGQQLVKTCYTWPAIAEQALAMYQQATEAGHPNRIRKNG